MELKLGSCYAFTQEEICWPVVFKNSHKTHEFYFVKKKKEASISSTLKGSYLLLPINKFKKHSDLCWEKLF